MFIHGQYVVLTGFPANNNGSFRIHHCYKIAYDNEYFVALLNSNHETNKSHKAIHYCKNNWRYATNEEARIYETKGGPFNVNRIHEIKHKEPTNTALSNSDIDEILNHNPQEAITPEVKQWVKASLSDDDIDAIMGTNSKPTIQKNIVDVNDVIEEAIDDSMIDEDYDEDPEPWNDEADSIDDIVDEVMLDKRIESIQSKQQEVFNIDEIEVTPIKAQIVYIKEREPAGFMNFKKEFTNDSIKRKLEEKLSQTKVDTSNCEFKKFKQPVIKLKQY